MDAQRHNRCKTIFFAVCDLKGQALDTALDEACGEDAALRADVLSLLKYDHMTDAFSDEAIPSSESLLDAMPKTSIPKIPERIGEYRILSVIGQGGSGVVYKAQQESPRRVVALKVLRNPLLAESVRKRFIREAEVVARLAHPGIAQIYAAGIHEHDTGEPAHIAMELVQGKSLSEYGANLSLRDRLGLFCQACDAVQYAHDMGVIHRDLKPANILVDDRGQVKVVDFGVARLTDSDMEALTLQTHAGQIVGTIPYMSPEQILGKVEDIDSTTDIYALGVVLYELLTGQLPHDVRGKSIPDAARIISEQEPSRLGTIDHSYRGDLELIVATALEHRKEDRYQSAAGLAQDIRHYLADEPISARPHSARYQLVKFARRNRILVLAMAAVFVILLGATAVSILFGFGQYKARQLAQNAQQEAAQQTQTTRRINEFLINDLLGSANPANARGKEVTVLDVLDTAASKIDEGSLDDQPKVKAAVLQTIGTAYRQLGKYNQAEARMRERLNLIQQLFPQDGQLLGDAFNELGGLLRETGRVEESISAYNASLKAFRSNGLPNEISESIVLTNLALVYKRLGKYDKAEQMYLDALALRKTLDDQDNRDLLVSNSHHNLGALYRTMGQYATAATHLEQAMSMREHMMDDDNPELAMTRSMLASVYDNLDKQDQASVLIDKALATFTKIYGSQHPYVATTLTMKATIENSRGKYQEAIASLRQAADIYEAVYGKGHPFYGSTISSMGVMESQHGDIQHAREHLQEALRVYQQSLPADHPTIAETYINMARVEFEDDKPDAAKPLLEQAEAICAQSDNTGGLAFKCQIDLADACSRLAQWEQARQHLSKAQAMMTQLDQIDSRDKDTIKAIQARLP